MKKDCQLLFLGTGGSMGTPVIGCDCAVCNSSNLYNKRMRPSALLTAGGKKILIDCGPDFKEQAIRYQLNTLDGIIFTHAHNDHTAGIDELRVYCLRSGKPIPCLLSPDTADGLKTRFYYLFEQKEPYKGLLTRFSMQKLEALRGKVQFLGLNLSYFSFYQLGMRVDGFRCGDLAYVSDIKVYPETLFEDLKGVRTLIVSALRFQPSPMHFNVDEAIEFAKKVGAETTWFMHIAHELDHEIGSAYLPPNIKLAYDGLQIEFKGDIVNGQ
jgi:phosphoribosyl 1,2-cyclic phosphate phosphodiesterase